MSKSKEVFYRSKHTGERIRLAECKYDSPRSNQASPFYRVKDGHCMWGYTMDDVVEESVWLKQQKTK